MSRAQSLFVTSLLVSSGVGTAAAQPLDARSVRPAVMLLVDTSGSMERLPDDGSTSACTDCLPTCTGNPALDSQQKNRWAVTVEALTGSFQSYSCQAVDRSTYPSTDYDYGYYLPHISFGTTPAQNSDGILDSFVSRVKFGLMTFDGVGTTIGGETLVPMTRWQSDGAFRDQANGAPGMYSYGEVRRLIFPGCEAPYGVNAGARGPGTHPGALVSVGLSDNLDDVRTVNQRIQSSLLQVRPFGGTPIAAMLDDLEHYVTTDPGISAASDPLYQCRKRVGVLITDGAPDALFRDSRFQCDFANADGSPACEEQGASGRVATQCECPYDTAERTARRLIDPSNNLLEQLVVVAYNVHEPAALTTLNAIAESGWPSGKQPVGTDTTYPYLITADGPNQLRERLDNLLDAQQTGVTSRSVPVSINTGNGEIGEGVENSKRFDINAGFQLGRNSEEPWSGLLYRRRVTCDDTRVMYDTAYSKSEGDIFHESLNDQTARDLFTVTPQVLGPTAGTLRNGLYRPEPVFPVDDTNFDDDPPSITDTRNVRRPISGDFAPADMPPVDDSVAPSQALASDSVNARVSFDNSMIAGFFGDADNNGLPGQAADRNRIVDYVRGVTRPDRKLADIYHSNPVVLAPLNSRNLRLNELASTYTNWQRQLIATGSGAHYGADGRPGVVFVGTNDGILHAFNLDTWRDGSGNTRAGGHELWGFIPPALFGKMASMVAPSHQLMFDGTPVVKDVVLQKRPNMAPIFRTVLISALRGAPAFVALDVTFPESPKFMWQTTFPDVGETVGNPALTQVAVEWRGETQRRAVAILPGGIGEQRSFCGPSGYAPQTDKTRASSPAGNNDRNVRCWKRRGRSLYVVDVATGRLIQEFGPDHFPSPISGSVVVDSVGVGDATAAYVIDHDGVLWRLSMLSTDPRQWRVAPIYDLFNRPVIRNDVNPALETWQAGRVPQYAPTLGRNRDGELVIVAGTGDLDNTLDNAMQRVVSLTEHRDNTANGEIGGTVELNWQIDLAANEIVTGPITLFENNVYFGTFRSDAGGNQCALGTSTIYGAHAYQPLNRNDDPRRATPALIPSGQPPSSPARVLSETFDPTGSNLLLGLTVARSPVCRSREVNTNAVTGQTVANQSGGGDYNIIGNMAGNSSGGVREGGSQITQIPRRPLQSTRPSSVSAWFGTVE